MSREGGFRITRPVARSRRKACTPSPCPVEGIGCSLTCAGQKKGEKDFCLSFASGKKGKGVVSRANAAGEREGGKGSKVRKNGKSENLSWGEEEKGGGGGRAPLITEKIVRDANYITGYEGKGLKIPPVEKEGRAFECSVLLWKKKINHFFGGGGKGGGGGSPSQSRRGKGGDLLILPLPGGKKSKLTCSFF